MRNPPYVSTVRFSESDGECTVSTGFADELFLMGVLDREESLTEDMVVSAIINKPNLYHWTRNPTERMTRAYLMATL